MRLFEFGQTTGATTYEIDVTQHVQSDAGSGCDAGGDAAHAMGTGPSEDQTGSVDYDHADFEDWYALAGSPCSTWVVEFHATSGSLIGAAYDPSGNLLASARSNGEPEILVVRSGPIFLDLGDPGAFEGSAAYEFSVQSVPDLTGSCPLPPVNVAAPGISG